ncbi:MAG: tryptophan-rich sensory protein [Gammaproteobacteria bacterium]|nr:tryptophan-rich sensory protein [Gammaproteobacteria bacterium]MCH9743728.1 tryptophan-rich sensory protein [Gammaproteobacteria bacterium]
MISKNIKSLISPCLIWVIICLGIASLAGWVTQANIPHWYSHIQKPSFNPPAWVFGPVWTVLYIMIGISGGIIWHQRKTMKTAFIFYLIQLVLNFSWSFIFFGAHEMGWAAIDIALLIVFIALTITYTFRAEKSASILLMPYFAWVVFAFILNISLWYLN